MNHADHEISLLRERIAALESQLTQATALLHAGAERIKELEADRDSHQREAIRLLSRVGELEHDTDMIRNSELVAENSRFTYQLAEATTRIAQLETALRSNWDMNGATVVVVEIPDSPADRATELRCPRGNKCGNAYHCADHDICAAEFERRIKPDSTKDSP